MGKGKKKLDNKLEDFTNKLENIQCRINDKPPALPVALVTKPKLVNRIAMDTRLLDLDNVNLLHKLYKIHVTHGRTSTFRTKPIPMGKTNFELRRKVARIIERDNQRLTKKLDNVKPKVETIEKLAKEWELLKREIISRRKLPRPFPKKQGKDHVAVQPPLADIAPMVTEKSLKFADKRPRVRVDVFLTDYGRIGKFVAMLYNDYEPLLSQQFLTLSTRECACHCDCENLKVNYIIPKFFFTIEQVSGKEDISMGDEASHILHHGESGVLSMSRSKTNRFTFLITFRPIPCMDSKYTPFGKVIQGLQVLKDIESFGTKAGHPLQKLTLKIKEI